MSAESGPDPSPLGQEEPRASTPKVVTISDEPEQISPPQYAEDENEDSVPPRQFRSSLSSKKLTGRPSITPAGVPALSSISNFKLDSDDTISEALSSSQAEGASQHDLLAQVFTWLQEEKTKHISGRFGHGHPAAHEKDGPDPVEGGSSAHPNSTPDLALDKLERILSRFSALGKDVGSSSQRLASKSHRRRASAIKLLKKKSSSNLAASSDTEYQDGDALVPGVDAVLDNTKAMAYSGGAAEGDDTPAPGKRSKDKENWAVFKQEIVRLTHTLRLKGWRRIPIERGEEIDVERLSGALTNTVYVVSPPKNLAELEKDGKAPISSKKQPPKLLLRIYGPQVEHLIDRESELQVLRRLARKRIGPRLLGTFTNGRFEEFLHARTLTPADLRIPETSKQIAKRMRELHDGIDLLPQEREGGPFVWRNWDKWVDRCEQVISWVDHKVLQAKEKPTPDTEAWKARGFVCGVPWPTFRKAVEAYRKWLEASQGGKKGLEKQLVFAHNDAQYGNLLRLQPSGESPLLTPANEHKQLVVIDFEYASANTPGMEFANHFSEWCYNYHSSTAAEACNTTAYPTPEEQYRFVRSYVLHRPQFHPNASSTPRALRPSTPSEPGSSNSISTFMLDSRAPSGGYAEEERKREEAIDAEIKHLLEQTRLWRVACSAQWVAWGIVQAKVPEDLSIDPQAVPVSGSAPELKSGSSHVHLQSDPLDPEVSALAEDARHDRPDNRVEEEEAKAADEGIEAGGEEEAEFDYLGYSQDRAFFFWGDVLKLGLVKEDELPKELVERLKIVEY